MSSSVSTKMIIPKTITVGYQKREDTYTKQLAYVIYTDAKGVLRKEHSWNSWRDKKIEPNTFDNIPTSGFVLNKKVGGYKSDWNMRGTYVRVFDPRGFEFEISVPNLLYILQETSAIKGKGLDGEFVYSWDGKDVVLLPTSSTEFQSCTTFSQLQTKKVGKKDMIEGHTYLMKDLSKVLYLGRQDYFERKGYDKESYRWTPIGKRHVFLNLGEKTKYSDDYIVEKGFTKIAEKTSTEESPLYADAYEAFKNSNYSNCIYEVKLTKKSVDHYLGDQRGFVLKEADGKYYPVRIYEKYDRVVYYWQPPKVDNKLLGYFVRKGDAFELESTKKTMKLPIVYNSPEREYDVETVRKWELYSLVLVSKKPGSNYNLTKEI